jgi:hypothetical protein
LCGVAEIEMKWHAARPSAMSVFRRKPTSATLLIAAAVSLIFGDFL